MTTSLTEQQAAGPKTVFVIAAILVMGLAGWLLYSSHENARQQAEANTRNLATVLEVRLAATVGQVDANLKELATGPATFILRPSLVPTYNEETTRTLNNALVRTPEVADYAYADATGAVLYAAKAGTLGANIGEAPYFKALTSNPKAGASYSGLVKSMLDNRPGVVIARPVLAGDGHVMGAVLAFLDMGRMEALIPPFDLGASGVVAVRRVEDGHLLLRKPFLAEAADKPGEGTLVLSHLQAGATEGTVEGGVDVDGKTRLASFRKLGNSPFFVVAAEAEEDYLEGWYTRSAVLVAGLLAFLGLLAWLLNRLQQSQESLAAQSEAHEQQENLLRSALDEIPGVVLVKDYEGRFLLANRSLADLYNTTPEEMVGKDDGDFNPNAEQVAFYKANVQEIMDDGNPQVVFEESTDVATGDVRYFQSVKKPFMAEGGEARILVVASDVTELKAAQLRAEESEKRLAFALEAAGDGLWDWQIKTGKLFNNARWCEILGRQPEDAVHDVTDFEAHLLEEDRDFVMGKVKEALASGGTFSLQHLMRRLDGETLWVLDQGKVVEWDDAGQPLRMVGSLRDVTEAVRAEAMLREARDSAEAASQAKTQFLNNLGHEIRTPLHGIIGMTDVLKMGGLKRDEINAVDTISQSARGLLNILSDMLDFSLMEKRQLVLVPSVFNLGEVLRDLVESRRGDAERRGLALNCLLRGNTATVQVTTDESRLRQILGNLLDNAIKFTSRGSVTLALSPADEGHVKIDVIDTGIGMDERVVNELFSPFYQAESGFTRAYGGMGMGLSVSKQLADLMGASLKVRSTPRQGSQFSLVLPLGEASAPPSSAQVPESRLAVPQPVVEQPLGPATAEPALAVSSDPVAGARVLLVDDNSITRQVANGMLDWLGCDTAQASNGMEALDRLHNEPFDLVLMDLRMPGMDGLEAVRKLRMGAAGPDAARIAVIGMATSPSPEEEAECLAAGMNDYLSKAIDLDTLGDALARWVPDGRAPLNVKPTEPPASVPQPAAPAPSPVMVESAPEVPVTLNAGLPPPLAAKLEALAKQVSILEKVQAAEALELPPELLPVPEAMVLPEAPQPLVEEMLAAELPEAQPLPSIGDPQLLPELAVLPVVAEPEPLSFDLDLEIPELEPIQPAPTQAFEPVLEQALMASQVSEAQALPAEALPEIVVPMPPPPVDAVIDPDMERYPAFDQEGMLDLCMNDKDLVEVILRSALNDVSSYWESLVTAVRQGDSGTAAFWVHTLKNLMAQAGGVCLEKKMERLENELKDGRVLSEPEMIAEMEPSLEAFRAGALGCLKSLRD